MGPLSVLSRAAWPGPRYRVGASRHLCVPLSSPAPLVALSGSSLCLTSCQFASLLTPCCSPRDTVGFPAGRAEHHEHPRRLQATQTGTDVALGTGQRGHQLRVTAREPATGPRLIGGSPPPQPRLEAGEPHGSHDGAPDRRVRPCGAPGAAPTGAAPASVPAWPGHSAWHGRRPRWERPGRPPCPPAWTAGSAQSGRGMLHGA
jgi:hypothetical protein